MDVSQENKRKIDPLEQETIKKVAWRLIPVLVLGRVDGIPGMLF